MIYYLTMKKCMIPLMIGLIFILGCTPKDMPETVDAPVISITEKPVVLEITAKEEIPTIRPTGIPVPTPTPVPTDTPSPEPTETPEPTPDPNRQMVALTFDDGPNSAYTMRFLDILEKYGVPGTFFVIGTNLDDQTAPQILQRMIELGCEIGMHDLRHSDLTRFNYDSNLKRIRQMRQKISDMIEGGYEVHLMRPPYGSKNNTVLKACKAGEVACILWSVDTMDWSNKNTSKIVKTVKKEVKNGSIILFHDRLDASLEAIDILIPWLLDNGYDIVTVTELLSSEAPIEYGKSYRYKHVS